MGETPKRRATDVDEAAQRLTVTFAVEEAIKLTVWRNLRRYLVLTGLSVLVVTLAVSLAVVLAVNASRSGADKQHSQVVCAALTAFAHVEATAISQQRAQTAGLIASGFTFGIPKPRFLALVAQSQSEQRQQLVTLSQIGQLDCSFPSSPKPKKKSTH